MDKSRIISWIIPVVLLGGMVIVDLLYGRQVVGVIYIAVVLLVFVGGAAYALFAYSYRGLRRKRSASNNPLDPSLRPLVASDISWVNCGLMPDFSQDILQSFRFLVEDEGFAPAIVSEGEMHMSLRRGDVVVHVAEPHPSLGSHPVIAVDLMRSPNSYRMLTTTGPLGGDHSFGDGFRGAAFFLRANLDQIVDELRHAATEIQVAPENAREHR